MVTAFDQAWGIVKAGDCYKCAADAMTNPNPDWVDPRLIHATVLGSKGGALEDQPYGHAYVAYQKPMGFSAEQMANMNYPEGQQPMMEWVHDPMFARDLGDKWQDLPRAMYERMYARADENTMQSYDQRQMLERMMEHSHYGPWGESQ